MALTMYETADSVIAEHDRLNYQSRDLSLIGQQLAGLTAALLAATDQLERIADHVTGAE